MRFMKFLIGVWGVILLSGCIAEEYDFSPPTVTLFESKVQMIEANMDWSRVEEHKKETADIIAFAKAQRPVRVKAGKEDFVDFNSQDFSIEKLTISVWKGETKIPLEMKERRRFIFPSEPGEYVIELNLVSSEGTAQYVANILIE